MLPGGNADEPGYSRAVAPLRHSFDGENPEIRH